jgi:hypothetical protein
LKDLRYKKAVHEHKRKQIGHTDSEHKWNTYLDKFHQRHDNAAAKRKTNDHNIFEVKHNFERSLKDKMTQALLNKDRLLSLKNKPKTRDYGDLSES